MPSFTPAQDGHGTAGAWLDDPGTLLLARAGEFESIVGLVFDTNVAIASGTLGITVAASAPSGVLSLFWVPEANPANYSSALMPGTRGGLLVAQMPYAAQGSGSLLVFTLGQTHLEANAATCIASFDALKALAGQRIALTLKFNGAALNFQNMETGTAAVLDVVLALAIPTPPHRAANLPRLALKNGGILG